jgi:hypothetical protein
VILDQLFIESAHSGSDTIRFNQFVYHESNLLFLSKFTIYCGLDMVILDVACVACSRY